RDNEIWAVKGDLEFDLDWWWFDELKAGIRYSELRYTSFPRERVELSVSNGDFTDEEVIAANIACRNQSFPESGFLSAVSGGQDLITNVDANGNVISSGSEYATFDPHCLLRELTGNAAPGIPAPVPRVNNIDVTERTIAGYVQADYTGDLFGLPIRGNFGVRLVSTDVSSVGLRSTFTAVQNEDGTFQLPQEDSTKFTEVEGGSSYFEALPSINVVMDLYDSVLLRAAFFRGLSRPDPNDLGFGRQLAFDDQNDGAILDVADFAGDAIALGSPDLLPLMSWNFDLALEWYPNLDSIFALGGYYKSFQGGFSSAQTVEEFQINGQTVQALVSTTQTDENQSNLFGFELTVAHRFSYLPSFLSGFGTKLSLNVAASDFEFQDGNFGDGFAADGSGTITQVGIVEPANVFGFSSVVFAGQLYYQIGNLDIQAILKHRSNYFQQFISTPQNIRYIGDTTVFEARVTYRLNRHFQLRVEGINLLDEPRVQFNPTPNNLAEVNSYGPRIFAGLRGKLW
ncbi:MAG: TonB-dependent receptor, partial [Myxococcota bacterium]